MPNMLEDLFHKKVIELPKCKCLEEMSHVNDPNYCHYHQIISQPVEEWLSFSKVFSCPLNKVYTLPLPLIGFSFRAQLWKCNFKIVDIDLCVDLSCILMHYHPNIKKRKRKINCIDFQNLNISKTLKSFGILTWGIVFEWYYDKKYD